MKLSIVIKALNEERKISGAIESCLAAIDELAASKIFLRQEMEVVLADSISADQTIAIARRYPIKVVQFVNTGDRGCGAGAQLAYQHARGELVYLLDGDMVLHTGFLPLAIERLNNDGMIAGVGGRVNEVIANGNLEFVSRAVRAGNVFQVGATEWLSCGGLYRRSAIESVGYFADRNLHSFEEFDLGLRLITSGWKIVRIDSLSVDHFTHSVGSYELLWKRATSGYALGGGEVVRASLGREHFGLLARRLGILKVFVFVVFWLLLALVLLVYRFDFGGLLLAVVVLAAPVVVMSIRRRSLAVGVYSVSSWIASSAGFIRGFFRGRRDPTVPIASQVL